MPIHDIQKRRQYYRNRYHNLKTQKQAEQPEQPINEENVEITTQFPSGEITQPTKQEEATTNSDKQYSTNLHKYTFKPIITIPNNNSSLDDVLNENANKKSQYVSDKLSFYTKLTKLFLGIKDAQFVVEDIVVKHGFDPEDTDEMYDFFKMIDRKLAKEEKMEKLEKFNKPLK